MSGEAILRIEQASKVFQTKNGRLEALSPLDIEIRENEFLCLVGPSGCGKSTLLCMIAGLERAISGGIVYRGEAVEKLRREIGMVFQEYSLLPWRNVLDNIALGLEFSGLCRNERYAEAAEFIRLVGMETFAHAFPHELSGGMRQRIAIARALADNPDVLLMDEPFGALDAHTRILLQKELLRIWEHKRKTILFVTHGVDEAVYLADRILVMSARPGRILEIIDVEMDRLRDRAHPSYGLLTEKILRMLETEVSQSFSGRS